MDSFFGHLFVTMCRNHIFAHSKMFNFFGQNLEIPNKVSRVAKPGKKKLGPTQKLGHKPNFYGMDFGRNLDPKIIHFTTWIFIGVAQLREY